MSYNEVVAFLEFAAVAAAAIVNLRVDPICCVIVHRSCLAQLSAPREVDK